MPETPPTLTTNFQPVATAADLATLDVDEVCAGYLEYRIGDPEPGLNRGRAYWHGWRNAARDRGQIEGDVAMAQLAHEIWRGGTLRD